MSIPTFSTRDATLTSTTQPYVGAAAVPVRINILEGQGYSQTTLYVGSYVAAATSSNIFVFPAGVIPPAYSAGVTFDVAVIDNNIAKPGILVLHSSGYIELGLQGTYVTPDPFTTGISGFPPFTITYINA